MSSVRARSPEAGPLAGRVAFAAGAASAASAQNVEAVLPRVYAVSNPVPLVPRDTVHVAAVAPRPSTASRRGTGVQRAVAARAARVDAQSGVTSTAESSFPHCGTPLQSSIDHTWEPRQQKYPAVVAASLSAAAATAEAAAAKEHASFLKQVDSLRPLSSELQAPPVGSSRSAARAAQAEDARGAAERREASRLESDAARARAEAEAEAEAEAVRAARAQAEAEAEVEAEAVRARAQAEAVRTARAQAVRAQTKAKETAVRAARAQAEEAAVGRAEAGVREARAEAERVASAQRLAAAQQAVTETSAARVSAARVAEVELAQVKSAREKLEAMGVTAPAARAPGLRGFAVGERVVYENPRTGDKEFVTVHSVAAQADDSPPSVAVLLHSGVVRDTLPRYLTRG